MNKPDFRNNILAILVLLAVVSGVLIPASPAVQPIPHRDSGVFLYIAEGILDGKLPYRDFWDHKGPLIYYIDAIGLSIASQSYWGVWFVEFVSLALSAALFFLTMKRLVGWTIALVGTSMWLFALGYIFTTQFGAGNHVEEYAIPFYTALLYLFQDGKEKRNNLKVFLGGMFAGLAILLRPNLSSLLAAYLLIIIWSIFRSARQDKPGHFAALGFLILGAGIPPMITAAYFWWNGALPDLVSDVLLYNFIYAGKGSLYGEAFLNSFNILGALDYAALLAWVVLIAFFKRLPAYFENMGMVKLLFIAIPIEIVLSLLSGFGYLHYFITWLPLMGGLVCLLLHFISQVIPEKARGVFPVLLTVLLAIQAMPFIGDLRIYVQRMAKEDGNGADPGLVGIQPLYEFAPKGSDVLFWGNEVQYNFIMDLPSPSRYIYVYPFLMPDYASLGMQDEFLASLIRDKPVIVDIQPSLTPPIQSLKKWNQYPKAMPLIRYITENYSRVAEIPVTGYHLAEGREWALPQKWIVWVHD